jgi:hypothetical protein
MPIRLMRTCAGFAARGLAAAAVVAMLAAMLAAPARAADPVFPTGSQLGIVPPASMVPSHNFLGFEDPQKNAAILFTTLPAQAYETLDKSMVPDALKKDGVDIEKREPIQFGFGKGFMLTGTQTTGAARYRKWLVVTAAGKMTALVTVQVPDQDADYSDKAMRAVIATLAMRDTVPDAEQLSLLPFKLGDLGGLSIGEVLPGRAVVLVDKAAVDAASAAAQSSSASKDPSSKDQSKDAPAFVTRMFIAAMPGGPAQPGDRGNFARDMFQQIAGIKDVHVQDAEPLRIGGQQGFETLATAKDVQTDADVMVVQWLRFGTSGFLQMIGVARTDGWPATFTRLRTVRDGLNPK